MNPSDLLLYGDERPIAPRGFVPAQPCGPAQVRLARFDALTSADFAAWQALSAAAMGANIFADAIMMVPALRHCRERGADVQLAIVVAADGHWLGVLPFAWGRRFGRVPLGHWVQWLATNQFLGNPLVAPGSERLFWDLLLPWLDAQDARAPLLHLRLLSADAPVVQALYQAATAQQRPLHIVGWHDRACHLPAQGAHAAATRRMKKAEARRRSLAQRLRQNIGQPVTSALAAGDDLAPWLDDFVRLERSGWKGASGSALASCAGTEAFFREAAMAAHAQGQLGAVALHAGGTLLAMNLFFVTPLAGYGFKMAYDERFAAYAPGLLLMHSLCDAIEHMPIPLFDSCTSPPAVALDRRWVMRRRIVDIAVGTGRMRPHLPFHLAMGAIAAWHGIKTAAHRLGIRR